MNSDLDYSGRSVKVHKLCRKNGVIDYRKLLIHMTLKLEYLTLSSNQLFMPKKIFILFRFWQLQKFPNFKRAYLRISIMALEYFFQATAFNCNI